MNSKTELPAYSGRMTRLVQRLFVARAHMAPHQKEREQGKLMLECCDVVGAAVLSMEHLLECLEDGAKIEKQDGQWHIFAADGNGIKCRDTLEDLLTDIPPQNADVDARIPAPSKPESITD
jgi:hypothetical protein